MGVFDFVKEGTGEMRLSRPSGAHEPLFVHPEPTVPAWALLDVAEDEVAVFAREGRVLGLVGPGRHTVHADKLAFLEGIEPVEGRLALTLVFVSLTPMRSAPFTAMLDPLADPWVLDAVRPLVDGELSVHVIDPIAFVEEHLSGNAKRPLLARRGVVATLEGARFTLEGRGIPLFAGQSFARKPELRAHRPERTGAILPCRACGRPGEIGTFCASCGELVAEHDTCSSCRAELPPHARFCLACGARTTPSGTR